MSLTPRRSASRLLALLFSHAHVAILALVLFVIASGCQSGFTLKTPYVPQSNVDTLGPKYLHNVSEVKYFDRISTANTATGFAWWDSTGAVHELNDYYNRVVVLNFFSTWSVGSIDELAQIEKVRAVGDTNVLFIGVTEREGVTGGRAVEKIDSFARARGITYQLLVGTRDFGFTYGGIDVVPTTFVITRRRRIAQTFEKVATSAELLSAISQAEEKP